MSLFRVAFNVILQTFIAIFYRFFTQSQKIEFTHFLKNGQKETNHRKILYIYRNHDFFYKNPYGGTVKGS